MFHFNRWIYRVSTQHCASTSSTFNKWKQFDHSVLMWIRLTNTTHGTLNQWLYFIYSARYHHRSWFKQQNTLRFYYFTGLAQFSTLEDCSTTLSPFITSVHINEVIGCCSSRYRPTESLIHLTVINAASFNKSVFNLANFFLKICTYYATRCGILY